MLAEATKEFARGVWGAEPPSFHLITGNKSASCDQPRAVADSEASMPKAKRPSAKRRRELSSSKANARARAVRLNNRCKKLAALQASLVTSLQRLGRGKLAYDVDQCHRTFRGWRCRKCGNPWATATFSCGVRLCPWESRKRAMRAVHRFRPVLAAMQDPRYIVLSMRNCALHELKGAIDGLFESFERLRHQVLWRDLVDGAVVSVEITFNRKSWTWHPHLNVLVESSYIPQNALADAWRKAAGDEGLIVPFIRRANRATLFELFKYVTKIADFFDIPEAVGAFVDASHRARFLRTYGSLYRLKLVGDDEGDAENLPCCPDCGSTEVVVLRACLSRDDVYFDGEGILRCCIPLKDAETVRYRVPHRAASSDG
jgi:hypothetical protein